MREKIVLCTSLTTIGTLKSPLLGSSVMSQKNMEGTRTTDADMSPIQPVTGIIKTSSAWS